MGRMDLDKIETGLEETLLDELADIDQTGEEARAELEADGVDVEAFLAKVHERVEHAKKESGR